MIFGQKHPLWPTVLPYFAWLPVRLDDGRWAWFETVGKTFRNIAGRHFAVYDEMTEVPF